MKKFYTPPLYGISIFLFFFVYFFLIIPSHAQAVSIASGRSNFKRETTYDFNIVNPLKSTHYWVWVDKDIQVQWDATSDNAGNIGRPRINIRGVTGTSPKKVCMTDDPTVIGTANAFSKVGDNVCKYFINVWVYQNEPTSPGEPLDSQTKTSPSTGSSSGSTAKIVTEGSIFKENTEALVIIKNAQQGAQYYLWIDKEDAYPQKTTGRDQTEYRYGINVRKSLPAPKKLCMNDVEFGWQTNAGDFPVNYECKWFVYINVTANEQPSKGTALDSSTNPGSSNPIDRPRDNLELAMPYTNYLHDTKAPFTINNPQVGGKYYVWVDKEDTYPKNTYTASSTDPIKGEVAIGGASSSPKKICLNDVPISAWDNGGYFPVGYECRLYVLIYVGNDTPTDQGSAASSNSHPQGDSLVSAPLPVCSDLTQGGKCTKVDSSIGLLDTNINGLVTRIVQVTLGLSGGIFLLLIIRAGYRMISSQGNPEAIKDARESLTSAIVGFLFLIFSFVILELIGVHLLQLPGLS